jgi:hypothetical protein
MSQIDYIVHIDWNWRQLYNAFYDPKKYIGIDAGRGSGKTRGGFLWIIDELLTTEAKSGLWVDVVQNNIDAYVEEHLEFNILKDCWKLFNYNLKRKRLTFRNGKFIQFISAEEPQNAEGFRYHRVVLNEGGIILKKKGLWDNTLEPMTHPKDGIENKTRLIGTMKGKGKFNDLCCMSDIDWGHYHFDAYNSPQWTKEELDKIKARIPEQIFRQEYMSEALDDAGTVFRNIGQCVRQPVDQVGNVMAVDLAKHEDFTVITVGNTVTKQVVYIDRFNQLDWGFQKLRIAEVAKRFNRPKMLIDSTGVGDSIFDDLKKLNLNVEGYKFTNQSKNALIENLSVAIDNKEIFYPNDELLLNELSAFGFEASRSGVVRYNAPSGMHDDMVISLALLNHLMRNDFDIDLRWIN